MWPKRRSSPSPFGSSDRTNRRTSFSKTRSIPSERRAYFSSVHMHVRLESSFVSKSHSPPVRPCSAVKAAFSDTKTKRSVASKVSRCGSRASIRNRKRSSIARRRFEKRVHTERQLPRHKRFRLRRRRNRTCRKPTTSRPTSIARGRRTCPCKRLRRTFRRRLHDSQHPLHRRVRFRVLRRAAKRSRRFRRPRARSSHRRRCRSPLSTRLRQSLPRTRKRRRSQPY